jgi:septal ring factor EnvC (AmiA/AmiB activator)
MSRRGSGSAFLSLSRGLARPGSPLHRRSRVFALALFGHLGLAVMVAQSLAQDDLVAAPTRDLERIEQRMRALEEDLGARQRQRETIGDQLERSDRDIADLARAGHELKVLLAEQRQVKVDLDARLTVGRASLEREREGLARLVRAAYTVGRGAGVRLLLAAEDLRLVDRAMAYYGYLNRERRRRIAAVTDQALDLERLAGEAAGESERLARLVVYQEDMRQRLIAAREQRTALLAELDLGIATAREGIVALATDAHGLRQVIEQLARQAQIAPEADLQQVPLAQRRGKLPWPLQPTALLAQFNAPKGAEGQRWDGVVLAAEEGAEVRALYHGRVVYADWLRGFGLRAVIDHGDGYLSLYGHNQTLLKEVGEWVGAGDVIALSGSSGGQPTGQLYFAIRHRGQAQDPQAWCSATPGAG